MCFKRKRKNKFKSNNSSIQINQLVEIAVNLQNELSDAVNLNQELMMDKDYLLVNSILESYYRPPPPLPQSPQPPPRSSSMNWIQEILEKTKKEEVDQTPSKSRSMFHSYSRCSFAKQSQSSQSSVYSPLYLYSPQKL